jgi:glycosyltransferase involved in cell wall biosynthesis
MSYRLLVDVQCLQTADFERGIPRWTVNFLNAFGQLNPGVTTALFNPDLDHTEALDFLRQRLAVSSNEPSSLAQLNGHRLVYLTMSIYEPVRPLDRLLPAYVAASDIPVTAVIHDFVPHLFPDLYSYSNLDRRLNQARESLFRGADALLCNSKSTARDAVACLGASPKTVHVVGSGIDERFHPGSVPSSKLGELGVDRDFIMAVGRSDPRKQTVKLIEAYAELPKDLRAQFCLVIACRVDDHTRAVWNTKAEQLGLTPGDLIITGFVTDEMLIALYRSTALFIESSLYEGFGFPAAEAAACGAVALTTSGSSLPEVLDDPAAVFSSSDPTSWSELIEVALTDKDFRAQRLARNRDIATRHDWRLVALRADAIFEKVARGIHNR